MVSAAVPDVQPLRSLEGAGRLSLNSDFCPPVRNPAHPRYGCAVQDGLEAVQP